MDNLYNHCLRCTPLLASSLLIELCTIATCGSHNGLGEQGQVWQAIC